MYIEWYLPRRVSFQYLCYPCHTCFLWNLINGDVGMLIYGRYQTYIFMTSQEDIFCDIDIIKFHVILLSIHQHKDFNRNRLTDQAHIDLTRTVCTDIPTPIQIKNSKMMRET